MDAYELEWELPRRRRWAGRLLAIAALGGTIAAMVAIVNDSAPKANAGATLEPQLVRMEASATTLARTLTALKPGHSGQAARRALHAAVADHKAVADWVAKMRLSGRLHADDRVDNALGAYFEYLDAVGSVLSNPRSVLQRQLTPRATRARAALLALPGADGLAEQIRGWDHLAVRSART